MKFFLSLFFFSFLYSVNAQHIVHSGKDIFSNDTIIQINSSKNPKWSRTDAISTNFKHPQVLVATIITKDQVNNVSADLAILIDPKYLYYLAGDKVILSLENGGTIQLKFSKVDVQEHRLVLRYSLSKVDIELLKNFTVTRMDFLVYKNKEQFFMNVKPVVQLRIQNTLRLTSDVLSELQVNNNPSL